MAGGCLATLMGGWDVGGREVVSVGGEGRREAGGGGGAIRRGDGAFWVQAD